MVRDGRTVNENKITPHRIKLRTSPEPSGKQIEAAAALEMSPVCVRTPKKYRRRKRAPISPKKPEVEKPRPTEAIENSLAQTEISPKSLIANEEISIEENGLNGHCDIAFEKKSGRGRPLKNANLNSLKTKARSIKNGGHRGSESHKLTEYFGVEKAAPCIASPKVLAKTLKSPVKPNHKLTEYYPVRRSVRKTSKCVQAERMREFECAVREGREEGLEVCVFESKGRGVIASRHFTRGDFVVEYAGMLVDSTEARRREDMYSKDPQAGCYMYYFKHNNRQYCIDATAESGRLGRLVNHSRNGNLHTKIIFIEKTPRLILVASQDISPGEELTYDYGDRSRESLMHHPWLAL